MSAPRPTEEALPAEGAVLEVEGVGKQFYGVAVLQDVSFTLSEVTVSEVG